MKTPDTSAVVAGFARWHEHHEVAREALAASDALGGQGALETVSVLTRMPPPRRAPSRLVVDFLEHHFPAPLLALDAEGYIAVLSLARAGRVTGGTIYDALVAATATRAGAVLVTLDHRAAVTYRSFGGDYVLIG